MTNEIQLMIEKLKEFRDKRDWLKFHNPKDLAIALVLESAEVLENFRFKEDYNNKEVAKELADVLNILLLLSDKIDIDIIDCFYKKLEENDLKYPIHKSYGKNMKYDRL
jgi:NTP pyrophosphatase (non-canonical NTP hydrolase)